MKRCCSCCGFCHADSLLPHVCLCAITHVVERLFIPHCEIQAVIPGFHQKYANTPLSRPLFS